MMCASVVLLVLLLATAGAQSATCSSIHNQGLVPRPRWSDSRLANDGDVAVAGATPTCSDLWWRHVWQQGDFGSDEGDGVAQDEPPLRRANCSGRVGIWAMLCEALDHLPRLRGWLPSWGQGLFFSFWACQGRPPGLADVEALATTAARIVARCCSSTVARNLALAVALFHPSPSARRWCILWPSAVAAALTGEWPGVAEAGLVLVLRTTAVVAMAYHAYFPHFIVRKTNRSPTTLARDDVEQSASTTMPTTFHFSQLIPPAMILPAWHVIHALLVSTVFVLCGILGIYWRFYVAPMMQVGCQLVPSGCRPWWWRVMSAWNAAL